MEKFLSGLKRRSSSVAYASVNQDNGPSCSGTQGSRKKQSKKNSLSPKDEKISSYRMAYINSKLRYSIGHEITLPGTTSTIQVIANDLSPRQLKIIPDSTSRDKVDRMAEDIRDQLIKKLKATYFALQIDESTQMIDDAYLIAYVRYAEDGDIKEDLLICKPVDGEINERDIFDTFNDFFDDKKIPWKNCIGICTDAAVSTFRRNAEMKMLFKNVTPRVIWTYCTLHKHSLVSKLMSASLHVVFQTIVRAIRIVRDNPGKLWENICKKLNPENKVLSYYCEAQWLTCADVIQSVFDLRTDIAVFLLNNNKEEADFFCKKEFQVKFAYLVDIFDKQRNFRESLQGVYTNTLTQKYKAFAFMNDLEIWIANLYANVYDMFPNLQRTCLGFDMGECNISFINHLTVLRQQLSYSLNAIDFYKYAWIRNPFIPFETFNNGYDLSVAQVEALRFLPYDNELKIIFDPKNLLPSWLKLKEMLPDVANKAIQLLIPFVNSDLCDKTFSTLANMKVKGKSPRAIENELRVALSTILPRFEKMSS